ncbi:plexin cytoplasmic region, partial [Teladorsagia circumcincta]
FPLGFAMDNVTLVRNLGHRIQMRIVPDPEFAPFKGIRIHQGDQPLILDGSHLNEAAEPQDYKIFVGSERCYVTLVDSRQLVCNGPSAQPEPTDERGQPIVGGLPLVSVTVGRLRTELGLIEYVDPIATLRLWVLVVTALAALCSLLVLLAFLWKKRRMERERDYRKIQMQMEHLESNVRKECKQAFAELQTSMESCGEDEYEGTDVTTLLEFIHRLLWEDNGWSHSPSLYASTLPVTLAQFDALLSCKQFVFSIVETAESETGMSLSERSMLSSLLIAVLLRNFQYCTDVVLSLLRAHIAKSVHAGTSDMLFRKSDSVVEKMVSKCKGTVQKYIEDFLESIMFLECSTYPPILKRVFDLLEEEATRNRVCDHRLVQQWKSNLYILRVWVHLIKNPKILLDVSESISQDGNLSVVAQTLEVARLRPLSSDLFRRIRRQPPVSDEMFVDCLNDVANSLRDCTRSTVALSELLTWVRGNGVRLIEVHLLEDFEFKTTSKFETEAMKKLGEDGQRTKRCAEERSKGQRRAPFFSFIRGKRRSISDERIASGHGQNKN